MSFYNTGNPVPSLDPRDLDDNAKHIDEIANSTFHTFVDRLGATRKTLAGIEADADAITLRSDLAAPSGASLVTSGVQNQQQINDRTVHIESFSPSPSNTWLSRAIDGTPQGWTLQLGLGPYTAKLSKSRNDIRIVGVGRPAVNAGRTAMISGSGTIIQGTLRFTGRNIQIERLGVDCGQPVCTSLNSGSPMDALVLNDAARNPLPDCLVRDCSSLLATPTAAAHNFLLEGCVDSYFENLHSYSGQWGTVLKTERSSAIGIYSYGCTQAGLALKSDSGATGTPCRKTSVSSVYISADGNTCATGALVYASTSSMDDIKISNIHIDGCQSQFKAVCDTRAVNVNLLDGLQVTNLNCSGGSVLGYESFGAVRNVQVSNLYVNGVTSNNSIQVNSDNLGTSFSNVVASAVSGPAALNVNLGGRVQINNFVSCVSDDFGTPAGINILHEASYTARIGNVLGTFTYGGAASSLSLQNGWTAAFGAPVTLSINAGRVKLSGRIAVPTAPYTGKETAATFPAGLAGPGLAKYYGCAGFDSGGKITPVLLRVQGNSLIFDNLTTATAFPTTVAWVALDGVDWNLNVQ